MKRFFTYLLALPLMVLAASCTEKEIQEEESVVITGLNDKIEFAAVPTGDVKFTIETNVEWSVAVKNLDWLTVSPSRGLGDKKPVTVVISPSVNEAFEPREGTMTLTAGTVTRNVKISQAAAAAEPVFTVDGLAEDGKFYIEALNTEGATFSVSSNNDWTAELAGMDWATVTPLSGTKNASATITVTPKSENEGEPRQGTISFSYGADAPKVVTLVQKKFEAEISLSVTEMTASRSGKIADPVVKVTSNAPWTAVSDAEWLTVDTSAGELGETEVKVSAALNETGAERTAKVTFTNRGVTAILNVKQGNDYIEASVENLSTSETTVTFDVQANVDWKVTSSEAWATVSPAEGTGNATVTVTMTALALGDLDRTAVITVASKADETLYAVVNLEQKAPLDLNFIDLYQTPVLFNCSQQSWNVANNAEYITPGKTGSNDKSKGTGRAQSYSHYENKDLYMQAFDASTDGEGELAYIMPEDGALTITKVWTDDAFEFFIPVKNLNSGSALYFDFGLVQGGTKAPKIWMTEVSFDDGKNWIAFNTGISETSVNNGLTGNTVMSAKSKAVNYFRGEYLITETLQNVNMRVRVRCVDGVYIWSGSADSAQSSSSSTSFRLIGYEHPWVEKQSEPVVYGPKIYVTASPIIPEPSTLSVSPSSLTTINIPVSFQITSNTEWTVTCAESWVTLSPSSGEGDATVTVTPEALEAGAASRTATITVATTDGSQTQTVVLTQNAPEDEKPTGNYVDLAATPVLYNTNQQAWNMTNNADFASSGQTGAVSGQGTGKLQSYSHYENPEVYMQYTYSRTEDQDAPLFIMSKEGNIAVKSHWVGDALEFHIPLWKAKSGQTLCFDYGIRGTSAALAYWNSEVSFDGGKTWQLFVTGQDYTNPDSGTTVNTWLGSKKDTEKHFNATYAISSTIEKTEIIVRLRCADRYKVSSNAYAEGVSSSATVRLIGDGQINADHANIETVMGPRIYLK